jgi:hypothetical protein
MKPLKGMDASTISVEIETIDSFILNKRYPSLIRMDVEGFEYEILNGMKGILDSEHPLTIFMEMHFHLLNPNQSIEMLNIMKEHGFKILAATVEPPGGLHNKIFSKILPFLHMKLQSTPIKLGYWKPTIDDVINNKDIIDGKSEALEIFFQR